MSGQEQDREALARVMRRAFTHMELDRHWLVALADAVLASDWLAEVVREAEQRGAERALTKVDALFAGGPDTACRTTWPDVGMFGESIECVEVPMADLQEAFTLARHAGADQEDRV